MYNFHVSLHARPDNVTPGPPIQRGSETFATCVLPQAARSSFAVTFDHAAQLLSALERMFVEPDGSFVWTSEASEPPWHVDGVLYDAGQRLHFVDLKGTCPAQEFDRLLQAFGWPETLIVVQLTREGVFLEEAEFRRWAKR